MRVAQPVVLSEEVRRKLEQRSRGRSTQARVVLRSRIVLLAAEGMQNKQIAAALKVAPRMRRCGGAVLLSLASKVCCRMRLGLAALRESLVRL